MQTIVSLIRLQNDQISDKKLKNVLTTIQNRISAMGHFHELLYTQYDISHINAYEYFEKLIEEIILSNNKKIKIHYDIQIALKTEEAIFCGFIVNAFPEKSGNIYISLKKINNKIQLLVKDDGIGYNKINKNTLGLILVDTLCKHQLNASIENKTQNGVTTIIEWETDYE